MVTVGEATAREWEQRASVCRSWKLGMKGKFQQSLCFWLKVFLRSNRGAHSLHSNFPFCFIETFLGRICVMDRTAVFPNTDMYIRREGLTEMQEPGQLPDARFYLAL